MKIKRIPRYLYGQHLGKKWGISRDFRFVLADIFMADYREKRIPRSRIRCAHDRGFSVETWLLCELDPEKSRQYLSDAAYFAMYPLNGSFSKWIDDKLTLKYLCHGTPIDQYMPAYYYQLNADGKILCLPDCPEQKQTAAVADVAALLRDRGALAIKLMNGAFGKGFYKAEYCDGTYALNGEQMDEAAFCGVLGKLRNYLITEYYYSHPELRGLCPQTPGSIRYVAGRVSGKPVRLTSGIAIGRTASGFVDNTADHVWCSIDQDGYFKNGELIDRKQFRLVTLAVHPDTGERLEGRIPHWEEIRKAVEQFCSHFPQLSYLGFDFVVTSDDRVKILEINSLSALDCFQNDRYGALESPAAAFFRSRLEKKN